MLAGMCVLFAVWVLVIPPFAGSDEYDHAYRAAAAARGQWAVDPVNATRGTGAFLSVPADIVEAAQSECQRLRYTEDRDCVGRAAGDDRVMASGAGRYHPLFYAVIGTAAKPFDGTAALYAMRVATALLAAAFVWVAARAASTWARTRWPYLGIAVACTPVALYSCAVASPNGVEIMSALALWLSLIGLLLAPREHIRRLAVYAGVSGAVLATLRPLGPLWCLLVLAAVLVGVRSDPGRIRELLRRPAVIVGAALVRSAPCRALCGWSPWTRSSWVWRAGSTRPSVTGPAKPPASSRVGPPGHRRLPAAQRRQPPAVYACYLVLFLMFVAFGLRSRTARERIAIALVVAAVLLFPYVSTVQSWDQYRSAWQGRYGLPLAIGIVLLAAYGLDQWAGTPRAEPGAAAPALRGRPDPCSGVRPAARDEGEPAGRLEPWVQPSLVLTILLAAVGAALAWWGAFGQHLPTKERVRAAG